HRQAVHADDFDRFRANDARGRLAQRVVICVPSRLRLEVRVYAELRPIFEFLIDKLARELRHESERIAREINQRLSVFAERQMEFLAIRSKRIFDVELLREIFVSGKLHSSVTLNSQPSTLNCRWAFA